MGYYINKNSKGEFLKPDKVKSLIEDGARIVKPVMQENLICVIDNVDFQAAGYVFNKQEFKDFIQEDGRKKTFLTHPKAKWMSGYCDTEDLSDYIPIDLN